MCLNSVFIFLTCCIVAWLIIGYLGNVLLLLMNSGMILFWMYPLSCGSLLISLSNSVCYCHSCTTSFIIRANLSGIVQSIALTLLSDQVREEMDSKLHEGQRPSCFIHCILCLAQYLIHSRHTVKLSIEEYDWAQIQQRKLQGHSELSLSHQQYWWELCTRKEGEGRLNQAFGNMWKTNNSDKVFKTYILGTVLWALYILFSLQRVQTIQ